jgi:hypothetical protein
VCVSVCVCERETRMGSKTLVDIEPKQVNHLENGKPLITLSVYFAPEPK